MSGKAQVLRRYPALGVLVAAGLLATMLPSALRLPLSGPTQAAQLAPVSGEGESEQGDLSALGLGSSDGLGAGAAGRGHDGPKLPDPAVEGAGANPSTKRCVGSPPRQTEDPMSPPCVAFFAGDNGGATTRGVTRDEIRVVIHLGATTEEQFIDFADPSSTGTAAQAEIIQVIRAYQRFVNERYQTYGRRVHFLGYSGPSGPSGSGPEVARAQIAAIEERWKPFAFIPVGSSSTQVQAKEGAVVGMVSVSFSGFDRADHRRLAPRLLSYNPDLQDHAALTADYLCRVLHGRPARFSGNPNEQGSERRFGLLWQDNVEVPEYAQLAALTKSESKRRCGLEFATEAVARTSNEGQADYAQNVAAIRGEGVTTVVFFSSTTGPTGWGNAAAAQQWYPEWVIPGSTGFTGADMNANGQNYAPLVWANAFGFTFDIKRGTPAEQQWLSAYRSSCGDCPVPADFRAARLYDVLSLLMWGIQAAGARLTPENVDRGLHAIPERRSSDPASPAAYFTPGNYSWVKDAAGIWWDPRSTEPGGSRPGCYRLTGGGLRARAGDWPDGDGGIRNDTDPCQGPTR